MPYEKPLPKLTKEDRPFWEAARQHRFMLPRCTKCGHVWFPPYLNCQQCLSFDREWFEASGRGTVFGCIEMQQPYIPAYQDDLPYNVVLVELEEGPKMYSNIVGIPNDEIAVGMPVEVAFEDVTDDFAIPKFRPRG
jgi:uncharacterized OB-fold protein